MKNTKVKYLENGGSNDLKLRKEGYKGYQIKKKKKK